MATTLEVDFYSGGSFIYALKALNKKGAPAIPCEINSPHQSGCKLKHLPLRVCFRPFLWPIEPFSDLTKTAQAPLSDCSKEILVQGGINKQKSPNRFQMQILLLNAQQCSVHDFKFLQFILHQCTRYVSPSAVLHR